MTTLLEIKTIITTLYRRSEFVVLPLIKFIFALIILSRVDGFMNQFDTTGKLDILSSVSVRMAMSLIVAFVPATWFVFLVIVNVCARLFFVSMEGTFIVMIVMMVMYLMFVRLFPREAGLVIITPFMLSINLPYVIPLLVGLLIGPAGIVPVGVGVMAFFFAGYIPGLLEMKALDLAEMPQVLIDMYKYFVTSASQDRQMMIMIGVFAGVIVATYYVSQLEMDFIHYIAIGFGGLVMIFGFIIGNVIMKAGVGIGGMFIGTILAVVLVGIVQFFRFSLDYQKAEKHQFEDDDYYYYVKAVPKIRIPKSSNEVKTIE